MTRGRRSTMAARLTAAVCLGPLGLLATPATHAAHAAHTHAAQTHAHTPQTPARTPQADCEYQLEVLEYRNPAPPPAGQRYYHQHGQVLGSDGATRFAGWRYWSVSSPRTFGSVGVTWNGTTETHLEGTAAEPWAKAFDTNRPGDSVGDLGNGGGAGHAALWRAGAPGAPVRLAEPAGAAGSRATAVNDSGLIVGYATFGDGTSRGVAWSVAAPGVVRDLGAAAGVLADVSADGRVAGFTGRIDAPGRAVAGPVGGVAPLPGQTSAAGNYAFGATGRFAVGRGSGPMLWDGEAAQPLPALAPGANNFGRETPIPPSPAFPVAVNASGLVVANTGDTRLDPSSAGINRASYLKDGAWHALPLDPQDVTLYGSNRATTVTDDGRIGGTSSAADLARPAIWTCRPASG